MILITKKNILEQFSPKKDKEIIYRKIKYSDIDEISKFVPENFHRISYMSKHVLPISLSDTNLNNSFVATIDGDIAGCILLGDSQIPTPNGRNINWDLDEDYFYPDDYERFSEMKGMQIVLLSVNQKYRGYNVGFGLLKHLKNNIDAEYLWGGQLADLKNQPFWGKFSVLFYESPYLKMNYKILKK